MFERLCTHMPYINFFAVVIHTYIYISAMKRVTIFLRITYLALLQIIFSTLILNVHQQTPKIYLLGFIM